MHYIEKTVLGLGIVLLSTSLLTACNTVKDTTVGVEHTAVGVGQTVEGAAVGAGKDINAVGKKASKAMDENHNEPAG